MAFDARKAAELVNQLPDFEFIGLDGETYTLPSVKTISTEQADRMNSGDTEALREIASPEAYAAIMAMPVGVGEALALAWMAEAGELGKEPLASSATPSSARR